MDVNERQNTRALGPAPEETLDSHVIIDQAVQSDAMLDSLIGPAAICVWHGDDIDITRFNQQFCDEVKVTYFRNLMKSLQTHIIEEDVPRMYRLLEHAMEDRPKGAVGVIRFQRPDGLVSQFRLHLYFIGEDASGRSFFGTGRDLTHTVEMDDHIRLLGMIAPVSVLFLWRRGTVWSFRVALHGLKEEMGLDAEQLQQEFNDGRFEARIDQEVKQKLKRLVLSSEKGMDRFSEPFDAVAADGRVVRLQIRFVHVHDKNTGVEYGLIIRKYAEGI